MEPPLAPESLPSTHHPPPPLAHGQPCYLKDVFALREQNSEGTWILWVWNLTAKSTAIGTGLWAKYLAWYFIMLINYLLSQKKTKQKKEMHRLGFNIKVPDFFNCVGLMTIPLVATSSVLLIKKHCVAAPLTTLLSVL